MAKLSARGRTELYRVTMETTFTESDPEFGAVWQRRVRAVMSDGKVLEKLTVRFAPDQFHPKGRLHDYGWNVRPVKLKGTPEEWAEGYRKLGWRVEKRG